MGIIERLGRVADTYVQERDQLIEAEQERRRVFTGHAFWPQEVLRDTIIAMAVLMVLCFYSWLIPPPLHNAADPFAQAGFVFPDWYVLFSYGYLRLGEYLPQFDIPLPTAIGNFFGTPIISWNAGWWGAAITGIPVTILALPPFLGGREKRGVEDPWFATAGMVYLAHVWFISVYSINIFLDLYGKNRTDFCQMNSHAGISCGTREPWVAEVFNSIPWLLTGVFIFAVLYFAIRWFLVKTQGARITPNRNRNVAFGSFLIALLLCSVTWPVYDNGFWDMGGFGAMQEIEELETLRSQPADTLVAIEESHHHEQMMGLCLSYSESSKSKAWNDEHFETGAWAYEDHCVMPAKEFTNWGIFQPTQSQIIDFNNANNHVDSTSGRNGLFNASIHPGSSDGSAVVHSYSGIMQVPNLGIDTLFVDVTCNARTTIRGSGVHTISVVVKDVSGAILTSMDSCTTQSLKLSSGTSYSLDYSISTIGLDETGNVITDVSITAFQPLILDGNGLAVNLSDVSQMNILTGSTVYNADTLSDFTLENPTFEKNPKSLDAKLTYSLVIPCLGVGALVFFLMRSMARGYEYEMNKCYGCDLCDDACPVRLFNAGDKLNIIYNSWNNEDDGVPLYSCLTCSACTNACPQLVDYDSYIDIRRSLIVGGAPAAVIPHSILQAVISAEADESAEDQFVSTEEYPIDSSVGYYPGCVDYIDQEMIFSHVNEGKMNLGQTTDAAFTLFEDAEIDVSYLGRDFLKCCGHDQKWQGMTEVFEKLKAYNQKKLGESGIETLVTSCAECFRTFAMDYELDDLKVMHTTEFLIEAGYEFEAAVPEGTTVTYHDPCRLGRQMNLFDEPRELVNRIEGVDLVEMEHHGEDALCCGVSSMMSCNENSRALRIERFEEVRATGAEIMLTTCPKCVSHFECLKFEGDPRHDFEILDVVSFLARQIEEKKQA